MSSKEWPNYVLIQANPCDVQCTILALWCTMSSKEWPNYVLIQANPCDVQCTILACMN